MDASRLLEVLDDVEEDLDGGLTRLLAAVVQQYTVARDTPTVDNGPAIQAGIASVFEHIGKGKFSEYPPSKAGILKTIGGDRLVGPGVKDRLDILFSVPGRMAAGIVAELQTLAAEIGVFKKAIGQVKTGFKSLGLTPHVIPHGQFEVGILVPTNLVDDELSSLIKELEAWNKTVRAFQEITGEEEVEVTLAGMASGSYETYIQIGLIAATYLSLTTDKILEWYAKILEIRKHSQRLKDLGVPAPEAKKYEKELVDNGIEALVTEIMKQAHPKVDVHRRHELETHVTISIKQIARFVDRGGSVEVTAAPPEITGEPQPLTDAATPDEKKSYNRSIDEHKKLTEKAEKLKEIIKSGSALRHLPPRSEPILQLEAEAEEEDTGTPEKQPKKKTDKSS